MAEERRELEHGMVVLQVRGRLRLSNRMERRRNVHRNHVRHVATKLRRFLTLRRGRRIDEDRVAEMRRGKINGKRGCGVGGGLGGPWTTPTPLPPRGGSQPLMEGG